MGFSNGCGERIPMTPTCGSKDDLDQSWRLFRQLLIDWIEAVRLQFLGFVLRAAASPVWRELQCPVSTAGYA